MKLSVIALATFFLLLGGCNFHLSGSGDGWQAEVSNYNYVAPDEHSATSSHSRIAYLTDEFLGVIFDEAVWPSSVLHKDGATIRRYSDERYSYGSTEEAYTINAGISVEEVYPHLPRIARGSRFSLVISRSDAVRIEALSEIQRDSGGYMSGRISMGGVPVTFHPEGVIEYRVDGIPVFDTY